MELEAHYQIFQECLEGLNIFKSKFQELMLEKDEGIKHIEEWSSKLEAEVQEDDAPIEELENRIKELKERENDERKAGEDQIEGEPLQWKCERTSNEGKIPEVNNLQIWRYKFILVKTLEWICKQVLIFIGISHPETKSFNRWSSIQHRAMWKNKTVLKGKFGKSSEVTNVSCNSVSCDYQLSHSPVLEKSMTSIRNW